jgi:hypothetical protein
MTVSAPPKYFPDSSANTAGAMPFASTSASPRTPTTTVAKPRSSTSGVALCSGAWLSSS